MLLSYQYGRVLVWLVCMFFIARGFNIEKKWNTCPISFHFLCCIYFAIYFSFPETFLPSHNFFLYEGDQQWFESCFRSFHKFYKSFSSLQREMSDWPAVPLRWVHYKQVQSYCCSLAGSQLLRGAPRTSPLFNINCAFEPLKLYTLISFFRHVCNVWNEWRQKVCLRGVTVGMFQGWQFVDRDVCRLCAPRVSVAGCYRQMLCPQ